MDILDLNRGAIGEDRYRLVVKLRLLGVADIDLRHDLGDGTIRCTRRTDGPGGM